MAEAPVQEADAVDDGGVEAVSTEEAEARARRRRSDGRRAALLIAPAMVVLAIIIGYPIVAAVVQSFQQDRGLDPDTGLFVEGGFAGFANYTHWLLQDCGQGRGSCPDGTLGSDFWQAIGVTFFFTAVTVTVEVVVGFWMAVVMSRNVWGRSIIRASVLVPWAIPTAVTAKLWFFIFADQGIVNSILGTTIPWTTGEWPLRWAVVIADIWKTTPFVALLIMAGLQLIPRDVYEAARIDGATRWQSFRRITLPLVRPALMVAILFRLLDALRIYDLPAIMQGGSTAGPATTMSMLVTAAMRQGNFNSASALSTIVFLIIFLVAYICVRFLGANAVAQSQGAGREQ